MNAFNKKSKRGKRVKDVEEIVVTGEVAGERSKAERQPASVTFLHQLNEVQDGLLLAGTADGAVRVWRNYAFKGEQRLATAWQVGMTALCRAVV